jgi:SAM-dependent methyltransferase
VHTNSRLIFERLAAPYIRPGMRVLELGPDANPSTYQQIADSGSWETAELATAHDQYGRTRFSARSRDDITYVMNTDTAIPVPDNTFDIVLAGQVIEHVSSIWTWTAELHRVCMPGGHAIIIAPISWPYHEAPIDCWRIYPDGMKALFENAGFQIIHNDKYSFEGEQFPRWYPGETWQASTRTRQRLKLALARLGWRVPAALDTLTIGQK